MKKMTLKEIQRTELDLLADFHKICEKESFRYSLHGGTLLGAVRHKGFIPWDDDVDVLMPRKDYDRFLDYCMKNQTPFRMISLKNSRKYTLFFARIYNENTVLKGEHLKNINHGLHIDIVPFDYIGKDLDYMNSKEKFFDKNYYWGVYKRSSLSFFMKKHVNYKGKIKYILCYIMSYFITGKTLEKRLLKPFEKYTEENSDYVCQLVSRYANKRCFKKSIFDEFIKADFEGHKFYITKEYDYFLTARYGDYMKLPPLEKRQSVHTFDAYFKD